MEENSENDSPEETGNEKNIPVTGKDSSSDADKQGSSGLIVVSAAENEEAIKKLDLLKIQVNRSIFEFSRKRSRNRGPAFVFELLTTLLSAIVTLLLGLKGKWFDAEVLTNIAFGISAFITVFAFIQNFFDYYKLWTHYTFMSERLKILEQDILLYQEGNNQVSLRQVNEFKDQYFRILQSAIDFLRKVRVEDNDS